MSKSSPEFDRPAGSYVPRVGSQAARHVLEYSIVPGGGVQGNTLGMFQHNPLLYSEIYDHTQALVAYNADKHSQIFQLAGIAHQLLSVQAAINHAATTPLEVSDDDPVPYMLPVLTPQVVYRTSQGLGRPEILGLLIEQMQQENPNIGIVIKALSAEVNPDRANDEAAEIAAAIVHGLLAAQVGAKEVISDTIEDRLPYSLPIVTSDTVQESSLRNNAKNTPEFWHQMVQEHSDVTYTVESLMGLAGLTDPDDIRVSAMAGIEIHRLLAAQRAKSDPEQQLPIIMPESIDSVFNDIKELGITASSALTRARLAYYNPELSQAMKVMAQSNGKKPEQVMLIRTIFALVHEVYRKQAEADHLQRSLDA